MADLKLDPKNARRHSETNKRRIRQSLESVGAGRSILADADGIIRAGNGVYEEWGDKPVKIVPTDGSELVVVQRTDLRGKDAVRAAALDNIAADSSAYDYDAKILADIVKDDDLIAAIAKEDARLAELLRGEAKPEPQDPGELIDKAAELQAKWQVQRGDLWQVGKHRLMCGDSTNAADVARLMGGEKAQLVFTDPPFNIDYSDNVIGRRIENDKMAPEEFVGFLTLALGMAMDYSGNCPVYVWFATASVESVMGAVRASGYEVKNWIIWNKDCGSRNMTGDYRWMFEAALYLVKDRQNLPPFYGNRATEGNVWNIPDLKSFAARTDDGRRAMNKMEYNFHPNGKPKELATKAINNSSNLGAIVLDLFLGSASTLVACEQTGRIGRGLEIEPKYVAVSLERLAGLGLTPQRIGTESE